MRQAVIDIGSNTLLLLVAEPGPTGALRAVSDHCRFGRLGQGLAKTGRIADEAIARSLDICRDYRAIIDQHQVSRVTVIATQALREAANALDFIGPAQQILGATIEVIAGEREAELAFSAVAKTFPEMAFTPFVVVDVGGGSTEIIATDGSRVVSAVSVPIGAVKLTERHISSAPASAAERASLEADIAARLDALTLPRGVPMIAVAGTATTLAAIRLGLTDYSADAVTGLRISRDALTELYQRLSAMTVAERLLIPGMVKERADVLPAGVAILDGVARALDASVMITCDRGIRWGVAFANAAQ